MILYYDIFQDIINDSLPDYEDFAKGGLAGLHGAFAKAAVNRVTGPPLGGGGSGGGGILAGSIRPRATRGAGPACVAAGPASGRPTGAGNANGGGPAGAGNAKAWRYGRSSPAQALYDDITDLANVRGGGSAPAGTLEEKLYGR